MNGEDASWLPPKMKALTAAPVCRGVCVDEGPLMAAESLGQPGWLTRLVYLSTVCYFISETPLWLQFISLQKRGIVTPHSACVSFSAVPTSFKAGLPIY